MTTPELTKLRIKETDILLEEIMPNKGKIIIAGYNLNYSYQWGSMGGTLKEFICRINKSYFASNLIGLAKTQIMDVDKTFTAIRKYIREELGLPWYKYRDFQKDMREKLKEFQKECADIEYMPADIYFVENFFRSFVDRLDYYLIKDRWEQEEIKKTFNYGFTEQWNFIENKPSPEYLWLEDLHGKLKSEIAKLPKPELVKESSLA